MDLTTGQDNTALVSEPSLKTLRAASTLPLVRLRLETIASAIEIRLRVLWLFTITLPETTTQLTAIAPSTQTMAWPIPPSVLCAGE